jgi:hypothetical protein
MKQKHIPPVQHTGSPFRPVDDIFRIKDQHDLGKMMVVEIEFTVFPRLDTPQTDGKLLPVWQTSFIHVDHKNSSF